ncbi:MAG: T9SS type A sorting domain-containing protein [Saprospiraceae bacterium]|nr:T9SS type A sorting domain-containing protein [Saprospiraceae bacterium]
MFQRQTRRAFPASYIFILSAAVLALLYFLIKELNKKQPPQQSPAPVEQKEEREAKKDGLRPAEWFFAVREYPDFRPDVDVYSQAVRAAMQGAASRNGNPGFSAPWKVQGPANIGARVNTIKVHPTNPNIIYIGYSQGGVWKTVNGGQTWNPIFDQQSFLAIGDIELDPQNPNTVFVGTGDPNISGYPFIGDGIWKSTNGGQTWQHIGLENQRIVSKIAIHPANPSIIYAATMGLPFERNNQRGLYKTTNGGQTWQQVLFVSDSTGIIDIAVSPDNPNVVYAAAWDRIRNNQESLVSGPNARIWKTTDGGQNWVVLTGGLPEGPNSRIGLSIAANNPNHLVAVYVGTSLDILGIYRTTDGGASWSALPLNGLNPGFMGGFGWYFGKIFINPFNPDDIFVCGVELWRSTDGGQNWFQTTPDWWLYEVHADMHDVAFVNASTFLLATDGGLYRSNDKGFFWDKIENIPTSQFYRVAYNPFAPDQYYGGMQDNGTSGGNESFATDWPRIFGGDGFQPVFHPENPNICYVETQNGGIWGKTSAGGFFEWAASGIESGDRRHWDMPYMLSRHDYQVMYTGTQRVYQSYGHLPSWYPISGDLTDGNIFGARYHTISTLDESPLDADLIYVGTTDGNVWRGNPSTQSWTDITSGLPDRYVARVRASPNVSTRVYVAHTGYKSNDFSPHLHRSDDKGNTWVSIAGDLPNLAINSVIVLPGHQDSVIFVGTDGGVYGTLDGGQHWERLGAGMPFVPVYDLDFNPIERTLIAGTYARSIMTFPLDSLQIGENVSTNTPVGKNQPSLVARPNPSSVQTNLILAHLPSGQTTEMFVADLSGRVVWQKQFKGAATHSVPLDVNMLNPGVYVVFARTGGKVWGQQKLVVNR